MYFYRKVQFIEKDLMISYRTRMQQFSSFSLLYLLCILTDKKVVHFQLQGLDLVVAIMI